MHKNKVWLGFLGLLTVALVFFTYGFVSKIIDYLKFDKETLATEAFWSFDQRTEGSYLLKVNYSYIVNHKKYENKVTLEKPIYQNPWAAEQMQKMYEKKPLSLWFSSQSPSESIIEKHFPLKEIIYTLILWSLWIYFLWIGFYVTKYY